MKTPRAIYGLLTDADPVADIETLDTKALTILIETELGYAVAQREAVRDAAPGPGFGRTDVEAPAATPTRARRWWRGPLVAVGAAAVVVAAVIGAAAVGGLFDSERDVADTVTTSRSQATARVGLFTSYDLTPSGSAEWTVRGVHHGVVYVDSIDRVFVFGGNGTDPEIRVTGQPSDQTLLIDLDTLTAERVEVAGPPPRTFHAVAYDAQSDRVILYGGWPPDGYLGTESSDDDLDDTWAFDPVALRWEQMNPEVSPPPSSFHDMVYDTASDKVVLIGSAGVWSYDYDTDTWEQDTDGWGQVTREVLGDSYSTWHGWRQGSAEIDPSSGVIFTDHRVPSMVYEPRSGRFIGYLDQDVFAYDFTTDRWHRIESGPEIGGGPEGVLPMLYDPVRNQIVLFPTVEAGQAAGPGAFVEEWQIWTTPAATLPVP